MGPDSSKPSSTKDATKSRLTPLRFKAMSLAKNIDALSLADAGVVNAGSRASKGDQSENRSAAIVDDEEGGGKRHGSGHDDSVIQHGISSRTSPSQADSTPGMSSSSAADLSSKITQDCSGVQQADPVDMDPDQVTRGTTIPFGGGFGEDFYRMFPKYCSGCFKEECELQHPLTACGYCGMVFYCSMECRMSDATAHAPSCMGAHLAQPVIDDWRKFRDMCHECRRERHELEHPLVRCRRCWWGLYCSQRCQLKSWGRHQWWCRDLALCNTCRARRVKRDGEVFCPTCQHTFYCSEECRAVDWPDHKKWCDRDGSRMRQKSIKRWQDSHYGNRAELDAPTPEPMRARTEAGPSQTREQKRTAQKTQSNNGKGKKDDSQQTKGESRAANEQPREDLDHKEHAEEQSHEGNGEGASGEAQMKDAKKQARSKGKGRAKKQ